MAKFTLKAEKRNDLGRKVKRLRKEGKLPANVYGADLKSLPLTIDTKEFSGIYASAGETSVVELTIGKDLYPVLIHNIQRDPVALTPIHIDFLKIDLKKKVTANIPVILIGESPAEKQGLGTLVSYVDEVEVEALPGDLIDKFELSVDSLVDVDQSLAIKDLHYDKNKLTIKDDPETIVVKIELQKEEVVEEVKPAEEEAVPVEGEGELPAEGVVGEETPKEEEKVGK
jgi:large subunit ribosomal protein L25